MRSYSVYWKLLRLRFKYDKNAANVYLIFSVRFITMGKEIFRFIIILQLNICFFNAHQFFHKHIIRQNHNLFLGKITNTWW